MAKIKQDKADKLFARWIKIRDNWTCQRCGKTHTPYIGSEGHLVAPGLDCSHFKGRGKEGTRFEPLNCDALCYGCHAYFTANPDEHLAWQVKRKGQEVVDKIILQAHTYKKKDRLAEALYWAQQLAAITDAGRIRR